MKIGMILECTQMGADGKVYSHLAKEIRSDLEIETFFLDNKPKLTEKCGETAKKLLEIDGCEKVIIIWDYRPFGLNPSLCPLDSCERVRQALKAKLIDQHMQRVVLICIEQELETLLLFDKNALREHMTKITKRTCRRVQLPSHPENETDPKKALCKIFRDNRARYEYRDYIDAEMIIKRVDINKLRRCPAFQRFERRINSL